MKNKLFLLLLFIYSYTFSYPQESKIFYAGGPKDIQSVALTFDDGPGPNTEKVLAILDKYGVKATFFMEGQLVKIRPELVKLVKDKNHEIGSHLYSHPDFYHYKENDFKQKYFC